MKVSVNPIAMLCTALVSACAVDANGPSAGNTELNLDIVNPGGTSGELGFSVDRVDYRITCAGNPPGSYPIPDADTSGTSYAYDDSVDISGAFEVVDTRVPPVWQAVMDLPPGDCTITLSVYEDDEIVCVGSQTLAILEDGTTKYDIVLVCSLSIDLPDGMADVDGTFEFITGNVCPKLYVLNAVPTEVVQDGTMPFLRNEIQYRAKDPDNTCGANCDPQSCTGDNPPVCAPYPSNINDPNCNPALGGNPNSPGCLAGDHAGLVCTLSATNYFGGFAGSFISPADGVTAVGPILPVNLNTAAGVPGIILPGLGGPAGTNAENSAAYPPLPNANGSLPPLYYAFDPSFPGPTTISLVCSDGDAECDQTKAIEVSGFSPHYCISAPIDCSASAECLTDGLCDMFCNPLDACDRCPGKDNPVADGTPCSVGACVGGVCDPTCPALTKVTIAPLQANVGDQIGVAALASSQAGGPLNFLWTATAGSFADENSATTTFLCEEAGQQILTVTVANAAGSCTDQSSVTVNCVAGPVDPCQDTPFSECEGYINVVCGNSITSDVSLLLYWLIADPEPIIANQPFDVLLSGFAVFDESFLDAAQGAIAGGVTKATVVDVLATVQTRGGGATGPDVPLPALLPSPECLLDDTGPGVQQACNPANDLPSIPGVRGNADCVPTGSFNTCGPIVELPISYDCAPGGECDVLGKASQCTANGFCISSALFLNLQGATETFMAGDGITPGQTEALFGWYDTPADATQFIGAPPLDLDGTYNVQQPVYTGVSGPVGFAVNAGGLAIQLDCVQGFVDQNPVPALPQDASPSPDAFLHSFPVQLP